MNLTRVKIPCPECNGKGCAVEYGAATYCRLCFGQKTAVGYSKEQTDWLFEQVMTGGTLQYDDSRDCCWIDINGIVNVLHMLRRSHRYVFRIKPDVLDDHYLPCDITVGDRVFAKGTLMRQLQDAINNLSK